MALLGIPHAWAVTVVNLLLALPLALHACPRSCSCPDPREVHCTFSHLTSVPHGLPRGTQRFNLGYNNIMALSASEFTGLSRLEMLMLHGNDIQSVSPGAFNNLRFLRILKLSHNKLRTLTHSIFEGLSSLVRLHLDHNAIEFIEPFSFSGLTSLTLLNLEGNRLSELHPHTFITLSYLGNFWSSSLRHLYLSDNQLEYLLPGTLQNVHKLEALSLHGNPWACDCHLQWLSQWNNQNHGVIKCKKGDHSGINENCAMCSSPQSLNNSQVFHLSPEQLSCDRPTLHSPLKLRESTIWQDTDSDIPYTKDLEPPLGHLTFMLSDSHGNMAYVDCLMKRQSEGTAMTWHNLKFPGQVALNVTFMSLLECEIDKDELQELWRLIAYYYESPAVLERGLRQENTSRATFQYSQVFNEDSPYFTDLKGHLMAEPAWLLQPLVTIQLNRRKTTSKMLALNFCTFISKQLNTRAEQGITKYTWALVQRRTPWRIQATLEGSEVSLECKMFSSGEVRVQWMLPDLSLVNKYHSRVIVSESGKLVIDKARPSDSGLYHCLVRTDTDIDVVSFRLIVREKMLISDHINGKEMSMDKGKSLSLPCSVSSARPTGIYWYLPTNIILQPSSSNGRINVLSNGSLVIINVTHEDSGEYSCLAANLYGADMLSHQIVIKGKNKSEQLSASESKKESTTGATSKSERMFEGVEEAEGSGYMEVEHPDLTRLPHMSGGHDSSQGRIRHNNNEKKIEPGESRKKANMPVDLRLLTQILEKAHSKAPTILTTPSQTTGTFTHTTATSATIPRIFITHTTDPSTSFSSGSDDVVNIRESVGTETDLESAKIHLQPNMPYVTMTPQQKKTTTYHGREESSVPKILSTSTTVSSVAKIYEIHSSEGKNPEEKGIRSTSKPIQSYRRRPPYRRRRPFWRRIQPVPSFQKPSLPSFDKAKTEKNKTYTDNPEIQSGSAHIDTSEQYNLTLFNSLQVKPTLPSVKNLHKNHSTNTPSRFFHNLFRPTMDSLPIKKNISPASSRLHTVKSPKQEDEMNRSGRDHIWSFNKVVTKSNRTVTENGPHLHPSTNINSPVSSSDELSSLMTTIPPLITKTALSVVEETQYVTSPSIIPLQFQAHEYLPNKEKETMAKTSGTDLRNPVEAPESSRRQYFHHPGENKKDSSLENRLTAVPEHSQSLKVRVDNTWDLKRYKNIQVLPTTSNFSGVHPNQVPIWPSSQSSQQLTPSPHKSWNFLYKGGQHAAVTMQPETTVPPTNKFALISSSASPQGTTVTPLTFYWPLSSQVTRTKDFSLLSRPRNRYRQHKSDMYRILKAETFNPTPKMNLLNLKLQQVPTSSESNDAVTPASSVLDINWTLSTGSSQHGSQRHYSHWGLQKSNNTLPSPNLIGNGEKPRIYSVSTATLNAFIGTDVYLPCVALGEPKPAFSWTKVSTGATIEENTKHGQRFEVLSNGTFVIKNVKIQDRGQYICVAKNTFGSDKMVITLAVLTQPPKIVPPKSTNISVYLGEPVDMDCVAEGKPQAQITWILPDGTLVQGLELSATASFFPNGTLRITAANPSSKGNYKCIASNAAGADTMTYHITVVVEPPTINEATTEEIVMPTGSNAYIHCTARGEPKPILQWNLPGGVKGKPSQFLRGRIAVLSNGTLFLRNTSLTDSGKYECSASNQVATSRRVVQLNIIQEFYGPQQKLGQQHRITANYGTTMYLHCPESINSQRGTIWKLPSNILLDYHNSPEGLVTAFPNGTLRIQKLTEKDGGSYLCMFQKLKGEDIKVFQVEVLTKLPKIERLATAQKRVTYGKNVQVDCLASGIPDPEVSWILPDGTIVDSTLQPDAMGVLSGRYIIFQNGTLLLQKLTQRDEGDYICYARNKLGKDEMSVNVKVIPHSPKILSKDQVTVWGQLGEPAYMRCQATGEPFPTITWLSPINATITMSSVRYQILGDGTLIIRKVGLADRGNYTCVARSSVGNDAKIMQLEVESREPQINRQGGRSKAQVSGMFHQTLLLDCKAEGLPKPRISWTTSFGIRLPIPYLGGRFQVHKNGSLEIRSLRKTDEGQYVCLAQNSFGEARIEIELKVQSLVEKPTFAIPNIEVVPVKPGSSEITLQCFARGKPVPQIVWVLPNSTILIAGTILHRFHHYRGNGILRILHPLNSDMGVYRCLANNTVGQAEKRYVIEPGWKPQIQSISKPMRISFGQNLNLPCSVDAWPQAAISWTLPSGRVLEKPQVIGRVIFLGNGTLQLREATTFDKGTYVCKATNAFGSSVLSYHVIVTVYPPQITNVFSPVTTASRGSIVKLKCTAIGIPKPDVSWTLPGSTTLTLSSPITAQSSIYMTAEGILVIQNPMLMNSGIYKCNARSALGIDFKATYLQVL